MQTNDLEEFSKTMYGVAENFSANLTDLGLQMRFDALKAYSIEQIKQSSIVILRMRKYTTMPTVGDFIEAIEGNPDDKAEIQKSIVMEAYNRYQPNHKFDDPITQGVIDKIGWGRLGQVNKKEVPFLLNDFKEMYKSYRKVISIHMLDAPEKVKVLLPGLTKSIGMKVLNKENK